MESGGGCCPTGPPDALGLVFLVLDVVVLNFPRLALVNTILTIGNPFIALVEIEVDNCAVRLTELDVVQCEADG